MTAKLRAAIRATPADTGVRRVYADWLIEHQDPRGEWIALHDSDSDEAELKRRALWQLHGRAWRTEDTGTATFESLEYAHYEGGFLADVQLGYARALELAPMIAAHPVRAFKVHALGDLGALAKLAVLETISELDLGYGLEAANPDALVAVLEAAPRLTKLSLSPHQDVPYVWDALARWSRLVELEKLDISSIRIMPERARWLATAVPKLRALRWGSALTNAALQELAAHATFELRALALQDQDGRHGRAPLLTDSGTATVLQSSFVRGLDALSLFGCHSDEATAEALANLPCAARLHSLDLGSNESRTCVAGLADATFPKLDWLGIRQNMLRDDDLAVLARFPTVTQLSVDMNYFRHVGVETILKSLPGLVRLGINDTPIGNHGVLAIAYAETADKLRHLDVGTSGCSSDAVDGLVDSGKLGELRSLGLACNEDISKPAIKSLADGPFDKMETLSLSYVKNVDISPLFAHAWLPAERDRADNYQRKLALDGTAVPHKTKPKKKQVVDETSARAIVATEAYKKGEAVKHAELGVGVVVVVTPTRLEVKFPRHGAYQFALTPANAIPFDMAQKYAPDQIVSHPKLGAGIVRSATADRVEIEFGIGGKKTLVHNKR